MSRNILARFGTPVIVILVVTAGACGGGGQDSDVEEQPPESQLFATDPFGLESGLAIVKMTHQGEGDFGVNLLSARQEETVAMTEPIEFSDDQNGGSHAEVALALADDAGPLKLSTAAHVPVGGKHLLEVKADGPWTVKVEQPRPSSAPRTTSFSGDGDTATPFFELSSGVKTITVRSYGDFDYSLLDEDANLAEVSNLDGGESEADPGWETVWATVDVLEQGIYLFNVKADGLWSIEITDGEQPVSVTQPRGIELLGVPLSFVLGGLAVPVVLGIIVLWGLKRPRAG